MLGRFLIVLILTFNGLLNLSAQDRWLSQGQWVHLGFHKTGVYKISYEMIQSWGLEPTKNSAANYHLLGIQGEILTSINPDSIVAETEEIAIQEVLGPDNVWGPGDYFLCYVSHTEGLKIQSNGVSHYRNLYSNQTQMLFGTHSRVGKRIPLLSTSEFPQQTVSKSVWSVYHDSDIVNLSGMGRVWLGERLGNETLSRNFSFPLPANMDTVSVQIATANALEEVNGTLFTTLNSYRDTSTLTPLTLGSYDKYKYNTRNYNVSVSNARLDINLRLVRANSKSSIYLDYLRISGKKTLVYANQPILLMDPDWLSITRPMEFSIENTTTKTLKFWNVSNPWNPTEWPISQGSGVNTVTISSVSEKKQFFCFSESDALSPKLLEKASTGTLFSETNIPDLLIISHESLLTASQKLANHRSSKQNLNVLVVTPEQIYDEFSGGQPDLIALRRCIRWMKSVSDKNNGTFHYVTLMGAASFDMLDKIPNNTNRVPIYQSFGHTPAVIFCLDEYIVYTEAKQGDPEISRSDKLGVSVGRIPARTLEEAQNFVDKLIRYDSPLALGPWRNNIVFTSDDADQAWESEFVYQSEEYAKYINKNNPNIRVGKIYADAFKQMVNGNSERYPEFTSTLNNKLNEGSLFINYQGHGGEKGLGQESLLDIPTIKSWKNPYKMPVLFTATCEFTKYDDPNFQSAGELAVLNPNGGAIASLTTTRLVYVPSNSAINRAFWTQYGFPGPDEPIPTVGDVFRKLKNRPNKTDDDKKFALLGDASMKLAFPEHYIVMDSVQGVHAASFNDTLKAFEIVTLKGHIRERGKGLFNLFNGNLWVTIFDKSSKQFTLDNDNNGSAIGFDEQNSVIYNGQVSVKDGLFTLVFVVPKDISYQVGYGKAIFYAHDSKTDASGGWDFLLGSSLKLVEVDTLGPQVTAYLQDTTFVSGSAVSKNVDFIARIYDKNGINATGSGIGRDMVLIIDEGTENEINLVVNQYFQYDINSFTRGTLRVPLSELPPGEHTFLCKVWDIYNNFGSDETVGLVTPGRVLTINNHGVIPNPITENGKLWFSHTLPGEDLKVNWKILNPSGLVLNAGSMDIESSYALNKIDLDDIIPEAGLHNEYRPHSFSPGIYFYYINITSIDGLQATVGGKILYQPK